MPFYKRENYRSPSPCDGCPAFEGMDAISISLTPNEAAPIEEFFVAGSYSDRLIYAHDPQNPGAGEVVLGTDTGCVDAFCQRHEAAESRVLGETHSACDNCNGPKTITKGLFFRRTETTCGVGFKKDTRHHVRALIRLASRGYKSVESTERIIDARQS